MEAPSCGVACSGAGGITDIPWLLLLRRPVIPGQLACQPAAPVPAVRQGGREAPRQYAINRLFRLAKERQTEGWAETALFLRSSGRFVDHVCYGILGSLVSEVTPRLGHGD